MTKKLIAFLLCMVLVICNSVSILADTPAPETTTAEKQIKETKSTKNESGSEEDKTTASEKDTSKQSDEETAPETKTTEKKEETTEATTEKKEESTTEVTTKAKEETTTAEKKETTTAEEGKETSDASDKKSTEEEKSTEVKDEENAVTELTYEDSGVIVNVSAEARVIPENAELSVTPIVKKTITEDMSEEEKAEAEDINAQYALTEKKLNEDSEKKETTMEGFLAYNISFLVDGQEVEPNGDVKVSMKFKESAAPEGISENASVEVKHLKEESTAIDGVIVESMTGKSTVETSEKAEVEKVEFTSDSFSIYTIYWSNTVSSRTLKIQVVDTSGTPIGDNGEIKFADGNKQTIAEIAKKIVVPEGYEFTNMAKIGNVFADASIEVKNLRNSAVNGQYKNQYTTTGSTHWISIENNQNIYFIYSKISTGLEIKDDIATEGLLNIELNEKLQTQVQQAEEQGIKVRYVWLKSENGGEFTKIELTKSGTDYNITKDGEAIDVVIDNADKAKETKYKVQLFIGDAEEATAESAEFEIPYYKKIQNGSFENPVSDPAAGETGANNNSTTQWSNEKYAQSGGVWQTTGLGSYNNKEGQDIEILNTAEDSQGSGNGFMYAYSTSYFEETIDKNAADGDQYAEINCETSGALYQDVLTDKNVELNYYLSHRARSRDIEKNWARDKYDTMYLVIMPTSTAKNLSTHEKLINYLNDKLGSQEIPLTSKKNTSGQEEQKIIYNSDGLLIARITSNASDWQYISNDTIELANGVHNKTYVPTSSLSRFFFISGATYAGNATDVNGNTIGNLVDDIGFGQIPLKPASGNIKIEVKKTVTGLTENQFNELKNKLTFTIQAKNSETGEQVYEAPLNGQIIKANGSGISWVEESDETTGLITATMSTSLTAQLPENQWNAEYLYTVTETQANIEGTVLDNSMNVQVSGGEECEDGAVLGERDAATFLFTNNYVSEDVDVTFTKIKANGDPLKDAVFALYEKDGTTLVQENVKSGEDGKVTFSDIGPGTYILKETAAPENYLTRNDTWTVTVANGTAQITDSDDNVIKKIKNYTYSEALDSSKTAEVANYNDRTYNITLNASSNITTDAENDAVDVVLALDVSRSMLFPSSLESIGEDLELNNKILNGTLDKKETYYVIGDPDGKATVYKLFAEQNRWYLRDASSDTGGTDVSNYKNLAEFSDDADNATYTIYQSTNENNRLHYLKEAASTLVNNLNENSSESRVGLVTFGASIETTSNLASLSESFNGLSDKIKALDVSSQGGTNQKAALEKAQEMLSESGNNKKQYVILVTDGAPNAKDCNTTSITTAATNLKNEGVTLITVGLSIDTITATKDLMTNIASEENGTKYAYNAEDGEGLTSIFDTLFQILVHNIPVTGANVVDWIDSRFELLKEDGTVAKAGDTIAGGTVVERNGKVGIRWEDQSIAAKSGNTPGWSKTFTVRAKDDFIGGNKIITNGDGSGITVNGGDGISFTNPAVNVKLLDLSKVDKEITVFLGDEITPSELLKDLKKEAPLIQGNLKNDEGISVNTYFVPNASQLTDKEIEQLLDGTLDTREKEYTYPGTNDYVGKFVYTVEVVEGKGQENPHHTTTVGHDVEQYILHVNYVPYTSNERNDAPGALSEKPGTAITVNNKKETNNNYYVNVVAGQIQLTKKLDGNDALEHEETFEFTGTYKETAESTDLKSIVLRVTISPTDIDKQVTATVTMDGSQYLPRGIYTISEDEHSSYSLKNVMIGEATNCDKDLVENGVTFTIGTDVDGNAVGLDGSGNVIGLLEDQITSGTGQQGYVTFINEKNRVSTINIHKISGDGEVDLEGAEFKIEVYDETTSAWNPVTVDGEQIENVTTTSDGMASFANLPDGKYRITEVKSPANYSLLANPIIVDMPYALESGEEGVTGDNDSKVAVDGTDYYYNVTFTIKNNKLFTMPEAGGRNIFMLTLAGTAMIALAGGSTIYYRRRRGAHTKTRR